jgi:hypothetical protein
MRKAMLLLAVFGLVGLLWAADAIVGTWKLNVAKSKVSDPSMMPKTETIKNEAIDNGLKTTFDGVDAKGKPYHSVSSQYYGKDLPVTGNPDSDTSLITKSDANNYVIVNKKAGKEVERYQIVISKDGKVSTVTDKGKDSKGKEYSATYIYDRQ